MRTVLQLLALLFGYSATMLLVTAALTSLLRMERCAGPGCEFSRIYASSAGSRADHMTANPMGRGASFDYVEDDDALRPRQPSKRVHDIRPRSEKSLVAVTSHTSN